jgi:hypothetical protein
MQGTIHDYDRLCEAYDSGDLTRVEAVRRELGLS